MIPIDLSLTEAFSLAEALSVIKPLAIFIAGMIVYSAFVFKFYRFLAQRDVFRLNLRQYSTSKHPILNKFFGGVFYLLEYIIFFPMLVFFWFMVLTALLAFLAKEQPLESILLVSMALVASVRFVSYFTEDLARDLAKILPFALLGVFMVDISYFSFSNSLEVLKQIPLHWKSMMYYLLFIVGLEFALRIEHGIVSLFVRKE